MHLSPWSAMLRWDQPGWSTRNPITLEVEAEKQVQAHPQLHSKSEVLMRSISPDPVSKLKKRNKRASCYINQDHHP